MNRLDEIRAQIRSSELQLANLRAQYREVTDKQRRDEIVIKAKSIQKVIEGYKQDSGIYERIEKAKQIAKEVGDKKRNKQINGKGVNK